MLNKYQIGQVMRQHIQMQDWMINHAMGQLSYLDVYQVIEASMAKCDKSVKAVLKKIFDLAASNSQSDAEKLLRGYINNLGVVVSLLGLELKP